MNKNQFNHLIATMYSLRRMIQAEQSYPHSDCENVAPHFTICYTCSKHPFCTAKQDFIVNMALLEKSGG